MIQFKQGIFCFFLFFSIFQLAFSQQEIEKWGRFEIILKHTPVGNAFIDDSLFAVFSKADKSVKVRGFYDGNGVYKVRFMPDETGIWKYETISNVSELSKITGELLCISPSSTNHGPVKVRNIYHFQYSDGSQYFPFGTTSYSFIHQNEKEVKVAMDCISSSPFNKIRFCVFPQFQDYSEVNPPFFPFERNKNERDTVLWDYERFNPKFFKNLENRIEELLIRGIEADILIFHPYDEGKWGFDKMNHKTDILYLKYLISRLSSYKNVWWSLANEYDFIKAKSLNDWNSLIATVASEDSYKHLCSIHNGKRYFENWNPGLSHASIQNGALVEDFGRAVILRDAYKKPLIYDEVCYEGNIIHRWGNLSGEELTFRFWQGLIAGTYITHGETLTGSDSILHLVSGRELRGKSPARIGFLRKIVEESGYLEPADHFWGANQVAVSEKGDIIIYFGKTRMSKWAFSLPKEIKVPEGTKYTAEIIDTWNMTITPLKDVFETSGTSGSFIYEKKGKKIKLPNKQYLAIRLKKIN